MLIMTAQLSSQGAWFSNGFANTPICCPSRAEIQAGRYMHNTEVRRGLGLGSSGFQRRV